MRPVYFLLGWIFFSAGLIGAFVPVLPTTPFMLLALWAFSNSSKEFHQWLYQHPLFGPPLQQWHQYGVIPRYAKVIAITFMSLSLMYMITLSTVDKRAIALASVLMTSVAAWMLTRPSRPPGE